MLNRLPKLLLFSMFVLTTANAGSPVGTMSTTGKVVVSGSELQAKGVPSWPVVLGDSITTDRNAKAVIASPHAGRIEIRSDSQVSLADGYISLQKGVVGSKSFAVRLDAYTVAPKDPDKGDAWFVVAERNGRKLVAAHRGDVVISRAGAAPLLVPAGSYAMPSPRPGGRGDDKEKDDDDDNEGAAAAGAAGKAAATGWTLGSLGHGASIALVAGIGAASTAGAIVGFAGEDELPTRSPSTSP